MYMNVGCPVLDSLRHCAKIHRGFVTANSRNYPDSHMPAVAARVSLGISTLYTLPLKCATFWEQIVYIIDA